MTIDERARHELFNSAERSFGHDQSETLMELLPPVGWADVATKHDLASLEERVSVRFEMVDQRFEMLDQRLDQRFEMVDQRFEMLDQRFEMLGQRFEMVDRKIDAQGIELLGELDRRFNAQTRTLFLSLAGLMISLTTVLLAVR